MFGEQWRRVQLPTPAGGGKELSAHRESHSKGFPKIWKFYMLARNNNRKDRYSIKSKTRDSNPRSGAYSLGDHEPQIQHV